jgi:hypothetical protein
MRNVEEQEVLKLERNLGIAKPGGDLENRNK